MNKLQIYKYLLDKPMTRLEAITLFSALLHFVWYYDFWSNNIIWAFGLTVVIATLSWVLEDVLKRKVEVGEKAKGVDYQEPIYINKVTPTETTIFQLWDGTFEKVPNIIDDRLVEVHYCNDSDSYRKIRVFIPESRYRRRNSYNVNGEYILPTTLGLIDEILVPPQGVYAVFGEALGWYEVQDETFGGNNETTR